MSDDNPYAAPQSSFAPQPMPLSADLPLATKGQRFLNFFIDGIIFRVVQFGVGIVLVTMLLSTGTQPSYFDSPTFRVAAFFLDIAIALGYYAILEGLTGRTIGKMATGTRVIAEGGGSPSFGQVLGRTLCRIIPFEPFSFLGKQPIGWHDSITKTRVVKVR